MSRLVNYVRESKKEREKREKSDRIVRESQEYVRKKKEAEERGPTSLWDKVDSFSDTAADKIGGGFGRGALRATDMLLPGKNTFGLEGAADEWDRIAAEDKKNLKDQGYADLGEKAGSAVKGVGDVGLLIAPSVGAEKLTKGSRLVKHIASKGKAGKVAAKAAEVGAGSVVGSGVDALQQKGRGDDVNIARSVGTGLGIDAAINLVGGAGGRVINKARKGVDTGAEVAQDVSKALDNKATSTERAVSAITEDIDSPAYMRRNPSTIEQARVQREAGVNLPMGKKRVSEAEAAYKQERAAARTEASLETPLDTPAYQRQGKKTDSEALQELALSNPQVQKKIIQPVEDEIRILKEKISTKSGETQSFKNRVVNAILNDGDLVGPEEYQGLSAKLVKDMDKELKDASKLSGKIRQEEAYKEIYDRYETAHNELLDNVGKTEQKLKVLNELPDEQIDEIAKSTPTRAAAALTGSDEIASIEAPIEVFSGKDMADRWARQGTEAGDEDMLALLEEETSPFRLREISIKDIIDVDQPNGKEIMRADIRDPKGAIGEPPIIGSDSVMDGVHRIAKAYRDNPDGTIMAYVNDDFVEKVQSAAARAEPPTVATLEAPIQMKVLDDIQTEVDLKAPGGRANQSSQTKTQQGAGAIAEDIDRLQKETGIQVESLDKKAISALDGRVEKTGMQKLKDAAASQFQDSISFASKTVGKPGRDFVYGMLQGEKFKRDTLETLRDPLVNIRKLSKDLTGGGLLSKGSRAAKLDLGLKLGKALDDRANAAKYLTDPKEMELFDNFVQVFDSIKAKREALGLEVLENYRPWVKMKDLSENPDWLIDGISLDDVNVESRFSKKRTSNTAGADVDNNLIDMVYGYVNSQLNEMAYDAPIRKFQADKANISPAARANGEQLKEGMDYLSTLTQQAVSPKNKDVVARFITNAGSRVYGAVLPFNPKLTMTNKTQKWAANSRVSKGAVKLSKQLDESTFKELEDGLVFGDSTVFGQLEDMSEAPTGKVGISKKIREATEKADFYAKSETQNIITSYRKGIAQAVIDSDRYKSAIKSGSSKTDAAKTALQDPEVRKLAIERGNMIVNDTQFGASHIARPAALRTEGNVLGIPIKSLTMFTRFPIGMSQHVLETLDGKAARALDVLKNGDPRAVPIAEMRSSHKVLLESMEDSMKAIEMGKDIGIPKDVLSEQIKTVKKNIGVIDNEMKKYSSVRSGKTVKNLAKMWGAAAAIQVIFDGGIQSFADDPGAGTASAIAATDPTATGMVAGKNSKFTGLTSAAIPVNKYGVNERALLNYVPGVGLAANRGRDVSKLIGSLTGE